MKTREQIARFIEMQFYDFSYTPPTKKFPHAPFHYGKCEVRDLMDFIFEGPPVTENEKVGLPLKLRNVANKRND